MLRVGPFVVVLVTASTVLMRASAFAAPAEDAEVPAPVSGHPAAGDPLPARDPVPESAPAPAAERLPGVVAEAPPSPDPSRPGSVASGPVYGVGVRGRWVTVPHWFLGLFTKHNVPLSTFGHVGIEGFRRNGNFEVAVAFSYQNMSPPDGNWLGSGHDPTIDTRYLQFRGLALYTADVSFIWHTMLTSWFGLHAGGGLGVGIVKGNLYLTFSEGCTSGNLDDSTQCHPVGFTCANGVCTPPPGFNPAASSDVLPVIPIVNAVFGIDFRLPDTKGWEAKLEAGFYDAFFAGLGVGYTF